MSSFRRLPYPGLRAFTRDESDLFFGREGCIDVMVDRLAATRFLAVLGPSGSGKSSLVRTGLLEALDLGFHTRAGSNWRVADLHPGGQPIRKLAESLLEAKAGAKAEDRDINSLAVFLKRGPRSIVEWVSQDNLPQNTNLLLLVDQFEELFRYGDYAQREEAEAFVGLLLESASSHAAIEVVITMRSEYLGACASIPELAERISAGLYLTPRMNREECGEAIEGPAAVLGFTVEPALVNRLLNDLGSLAPWEESAETDLAEHLAHQADQLPLMQHVLNRLWVEADRQSSGSEVELKLADYKRFGGLSGALDAHGNEVMAALGEIRAPMIESVFRSLASGTSPALAVRRPCRMGELIEVANGARNEVVAIVEAFTAAGCNFLRTSEESLAGDQVIVDISHESLIRQWILLRNWVEKEARAAAAWRRVVAAEEHYSQREGGLLTGLDLQNLVAWWKSANPTEIWAARYGDKFEAAQAFIESSRRAEAERVEAERHRQTRERNLLRIGVAGLAILLLVVGTLGVEFRRAKQEADRQRDAARASANEADSERDAANKAKRDAETQQHTAERMAAAAKTAESEVEKQRQEAVKQKDIAEKAAEMAEAALRKAAHETDRANTEQSSREATERRQADREKRTERETSELRSPEERTALPLAKSGVTANDQTSTGNEGLREKSRSNSANSVVASLPNGEHLAENTPILVLGETGSKDSRSAAQNSHQEAEDMENEGDAPGALKMYERAYQQAGDAIASITSGEVPPEALAADFIDCGYSYAWYLFDLDRKAEGNAILARLSDLASLYPPRTASTRLLMGRAKIENLKRRTASESAVAAEHSRTGINLASVALEEDSSLESARLLFRLDENHSLTKEIPEKEKAEFKARGCVVAEQMFAKFPADMRSVDAQVQCLRDLAHDAQSKEDLAGAAARFGSAQKIISGALQHKPADQRLLLLMASIEDDLAFLPSLDENGRNQHKLQVQGYFVKAMKNRTVFPSAAGLRDLYVDVRYVDFPQVAGETVPQKEITFYQEIAQAMQASVQAFPNDPDFTYIEADASLRLAKALEADPKRNAEAEGYLTNAILWFDKSVEVGHPASFSEDFASYCGAYKERAELYSKTPRTDLMVTDIKKLRAMCTPALEKYPFDFYLRQHFIQTARLAGQTLFDLHRYHDALPYLEYASHWGRKDSSTLLMKMYHEGLGVVPDKKRAAALGELAGKQSMRRFTVPADFGGQKAPFDFYVLQWPDEYPFQGIDDQIQWLKEARGGVVPVEVAEAFRKLDKIARESKRSFPDLCAYALATNDVEASRKKYAADPNPESLESFRAAANQQYTDLVQAKKQSEADALQKELAADAEDLVQKKPSSATYRVAWYIFTDQGDRLQSSDPVAARQAFARSSELADLLPEDSTEDLHRRLFAMNALGIWTRKVAESRTLRNVTQKKSMPHERNI